MRVEGKRGGRRRRIGPAATVKRLAAQGVTAPMDHAAAVFQARRRRGMTRRSLPARLSRSLAA